MRLLPKPLQLLGPLSRLLVRYVLRQFEAKWQDVDQEASLDKVCFSTIALHGCNVTRWHIAECHQPVACQLKHATQCCIALTLRNFIRCENGKVHVRVHGRVTQADYTCWTLDAVACIHLYSCRSELQSQLESQHRSGSPLNRAFSTITLCGCRPKLDFRCCLTLCKPAAGNLCLES